MTGVKAPFIIQALYDDRGFKKFKKDTQQLGKTQKQTTEQTNKATRSTNQFHKALKRVAVVVPIWMAARAAIRLVTQTIGDGLQLWKDYSKQLEKAKQVMSGFTGTFEQAVATLEQEALALSINTGESIDNLAEAFMRFGTVGLNFEDSMAGMRVSNKLAIAMFGETNEIARVLAQTYRLLGDSMEGTMSPMEKMEAIGGMLFKLWKTNAFEIGEMTQALQKFLPIANTMNFTVDQTLGLLASLQTAGLKAGRAGRLLRTTVTKMVDNLGDLGDVLGIRVNTEMESTFDVLMKVIDGVGQLSKTSGRLPVEIQKALGIFGGVRSRQAAQALVALREILQQNLDLVEEGNWDKLGKELSKGLEEVGDSVYRQAKRFENLKKIIGKSFLEGVTGADDFKDSIKRVNEVLENAVFWAKGLGEAIHNIPPALLAGLISGGMAAAGGVTPLSIGVGIAGGVTAYKFLVQYRDYIDQLHDLRSEYTKLMGEMGGTTTEFGDFSQLGIMPEKGIDELLKTINKFEIFKKEVEKRGIDINLELGKQTRKELEKQLEAMIQLTHVRADYNDLIPRGVALTVEQINNIQTLIKATDTREQQQKAIAKYLNEIQHYGVSIRTQEEKRIDNAERFLQIAKLEALEVKDSVILQEKLNQAIEERAEIIAKDEVEGEKDRLELQKEYEEKIKSIIDLEKVSSDNVGDVYKRLKDIGIEADNAHEIFQLFLEVWKATNKEAMDFEFQLNQAKMLGHDAVGIEMEKLRLMKLQGAELDERKGQEEEVVKAMQEEMIEFSNTIKSAFEGGLKDLLKGDIGIVEFGERLGSKIRDAMLGGVAESLTEMIFTTTGLGGIFGTVGGTIKNAHRQGSIELYNRIIQAHTEGADIISRASGGGGVSVPSSLQVGMGGQLMGLPGMGKLGGFLNKPIGGYNYEEIAEGMKGVRMSGGKPLGQNLTYGQGLGLIGSTAMMGLAGAQRGGTAGGIMGGAGGFLLGGHMLATSGAIRGSIGGMLGGSMIPGIGIALAVGSMLMGMRSKTEEQTRKETRNVGSKIDITNKKLDIVNRNLVSIEQTFSFIMQESAYFSARQNTLNDFRVNSQRG